ncbi:hypothetical protein [Roseateles violae]|uniref:Uncharacterized protein n=1 Tax=Roseateles violae TaxID=3058042 RepID=A0ABT8DXU6_9BURK|nr:hypothetical protein [Pelomonas sp. PFR6]MDN3922483.1 hypothetical protein [Pelomonas sp. PFR6]
MIEKFLAALVLLICIALALRMALPAAQQRRLDERLRRLGRGLQSGWQRARRWRTRRASAAEHRAAAAEAEAAIRRARAGSKMVDGEWDGNVYRPKSFKGRKRDKRNLH